MRTKSIEGIQLEEAKLIANVLVFLRIDVNVPVYICSVMSGRFVDRAYIKQRIERLVQGHKRLPLVMLEPAVTEPLYCIL